jgi:putative tryptophan/tyrosine transport system substrate-binding protein
MRRREFIAGLGSAAAAWPLVAQAQESTGMRRVGVLMATAADDPEGQARISAFLDALQQLGWTDGRNVRIDIRWPADADADVLRRDAAELIALPVAILDIRTASFDIRFTSPSSPLPGCDRFSHNKWSRRL